MMRRVLVSACTIFLMVGLTTVSADLKEDINAVSNYDQAKAIVAVGAVASEIIELADQAGAIQRVLIIAALIEKYGSDKLHGVLVELFGVDKAANLLAEGTTVLAQFGGLRKLIPVKHNSPIDNRGGGQTLASPS